MNRQRYCTFRSGIFFFAEECWVEGFGSCSDLWVIWCSANKTHTHTHTTHRHTHSHTIPHTVPHSKHTQYFTAAHTQNSQGRKVFEDFRSLIQCYQLIPDNTQLFFLPFLKLAILYRYEFRKRNKKDHCRSPALCLK